MKETHIFRSKHPGVLAQKQLALYHSLLKLNMMTPYGSIKLSHTSHSSLAFSTPTGRSSPGPNAKKGLSQHQPAKNL